MTGWMREGRGERDALERSKGTHTCEIATTQPGTFYAELKYNFPEKKKEGLGGCSAPRHEGLSSVPRIQVKSQVWC